VRHHHERHA